MDLEQKWKLQNIITILNLTFKHSEGKYKALHYNGLNIFIKVLMKFLPNMNESEPDCLIQNMFELIHGLLDESENIKFKINKRSNIDIEDDQMVNIYDEEECLDNVKLCINKINTIEQKGNKYKNQLVQDLIRILPILTRDFVKPSQYIVNSFEQYIEFDDQQIKKENQEKINKFMEIAEKVPEYFQSFREETINSGILNKATQLFLQIVSDYSKINQAKIKQYNTSLQRCLQIFMSLIKGNHNIQLILSKQGILHSIYQLTDTSIKIKEIGKISEDIIEYIVCEKNMVHKEVQNLIIKIKHEDAQIKKEKAHQVKLNQLQMLNTNAQKIKQVFDFGDLEEETSIKCVVCQEGYTLRPKDILGAYIYSTSYNIFDIQKLVYEGNSYVDKSSVTSVTSFNLIHLKCHQEAVQADQNSKKPKTEWEGALIRNSEAKCNNWFPLKGPEIDQNQTENALKKYFKCIGQQSISGNQATWIIMNDFKGLLMKFANQEDIAKETRTTFEHNIKILPFFISIITY
ncbi:hypothetical protein IMG5_004030 [Ichthyophthirius multifiliis]|uniref:E3 ubiquitin ligase UBR4 C-terminal domain-containing protein n=1 Tax=Ichthyophthirius multifiliis TaxID=5932 RepID=G0QJC4_ICHMU|nr:hypothetical protein IMG5_004030 [Ichthyophthirius multifiliis]EGR34687.1 hypothetical protein IMG5_004030 [Ichthyophthirius multifiliis]|eukprot:XP_004039991.1 hypothetical protein IMG5_004030 [Ichthyophthirius multifiliis]